MPPAVIASEARQTMCAIAGLYAFAASAPPADRAELRTADPMSARGPDGHTGFFLWGSVPAPYTLYPSFADLPQPLCR